MKKSRIYIIAGAIILAIILVFFYKINYKKINNGNNMSNKTLDEYEEYVGNISSYITTEQITVSSNKNTNKYIVKQEYNR